MCNDLKCISLCCRPCFPARGHICQLYVYYIKDTVIWTVGCYTYYILTRAARESSYNNGSDPLPRKVGRACRRMCCVESGFSSNEGRCSGIFTGQWIMCTPCEQARQAFTTSYGKVFCVTLLFCGFACVAKSLV